MRENRPTYHIKSNNRVTKLLFYMPHSIVTKSARKKYKMHQVEEDDDGNHEGEEISTRVNQAERDHII